MSVFMMCMKRCILYFGGGVQVLLHLQEMYFIDYVVWIFCIFTDFLTPDETWAESGMF